MNATKQRNRALAKANRHRLAVAEKRREIAAMDRIEAAFYLADLIETADDPELLSGRISHYLTAIPGRGPTYSTRVLADLGVKIAARRLRDLSPRQREILADEIRTRR